MNIVEALTNHHGVLRELYEKAEADPSVFDLFIHHLIVHHTMEEKYFYDLLEQFTEAEHDALEAVNEHHIIEMIIKDAQGFPRDHRNFPIKIEGLGEYTVHHLDEEEMEIFPMASRLFSDEELQALGLLFEEAKKELLGLKLPELPNTIAAKFDKKKDGYESQPVGVQASGLETARGLGIGKL